MYSIINITEIGSLYTNLTYIQFRMVIPLHENDHIWSALSKTENF